MQACNSRFSAMRLFLLALPALILVVLVACQDDDVCEDATANDLRTWFYPVDQEDDFWAVIDSLRVYTLEKPDTPVFDTLYSVSSLELPLNTNADSCSFVIDFFHTRDTLWLYYERETHLISVECGFTMFFDLQHVEYTTHFIESLSIEEPHVTNSLDEHIKIFVPDTIPGN